MKLLLTFSHSLSLQRLTTSLLFTFQTVQTSSAWRPPMPLPNGDKSATNTENLERRSTTQIGQITSVPPHHHHLSDSYTMGGNGGGFESQYAITPEKKELPVSSSAKDKKWSIGGLFRRKKKAAGFGSSSEEDYAENGGVARRINGAKEAKKGGSKRTSKVGGFDHIVQVPTADSFGSSQRQSGSLDRSNVPSYQQHFKPASNDSQQHRSSDDELFLGIRSCNSSNISRFRSDDSLMTNQSTPSSRKSRAARTERYMKRRSRDGEGANPLIVGGPYIQNNEPVQSRWKTQPIMFHGSNQSMTPSSTYSANYQQQQQQHQLHPHQSYNNLQNSTSMSQVPQVINFQMNYSSTPPQQHHQHAGGRINPENRSFSYDNYINQFSLPKNKQPNHYANQQQLAYQNNMTNPPPPPPPRDPMRRLTVDTTQSAQSRPISYAFDKYNQGLGAEVKGRNLGERCVSDDHLWSQNGLLLTNPTAGQFKQSPAHYSNVSMRAGSVQTKDSPTQSRKHTGGPSQQQPFKYVADATPRSRKPIHVLEDLQQSNAAAMKNYQAQRNKSRSATDFWKKIDQQVAHVPKERTESLSLVQPKAIKQKVILTPQRSLDTDLKSNSLTRSYRFDVPVPQSCGQILDDAAVIVEDKCRFKPVNKYEEHIAKNMAVNNLRSPIMVAQQKKNVRSAPSSHVKESQPRNGQWTISGSGRDVVDCVKSKNLEDAINELEAIYKSLKLSDEELLDRADRRDIPSPTGFSKKVKEYQYDDDEDDDENGMRKEPDILLDDVVYRNLKHANKFPKVTDAQPPFGIPVGPIPPPATQDYLKVTPISSNASTSSMSPVGDRVKLMNRDSPDLVFDDLAVRNLRKDNGQLLKSNHFVQPVMTSSSSGKKKPVRSQSANIYNLIHRDASRPSGGSLEDYNVFDALSKKLINLTDADSDVTDVPVTVSALRKKEGTAKPRETRYKTISSFLHPNNTSGAVFNLPSTLQQKPPIPTPRMSLSPYLTDDSTIVAAPQSTDSSGIDVLNKLVMDARISSEKLSKDLDDLRKEGKVAKEDKNLRVTSQSPLAKRIDLLEKSPSPKIIADKRFTTPSPDANPSPVECKLKIFSPKVIESEETPKIVKEEVILPVEKVNQLVEKFNERIKEESRESSPVATPKKSSKSTTPSNKKSKSLTNKIKLLEDINDASKAVRACEQMLVDVVQDTPKNMLSDKKLLDDINEVSLAMKGCEKVLKGVIPVDGSDFDDRSTDKGTPERQSLVLDCEIPVSVRALKEAYEKESKASSPVLVEKFAEVTPATPIVNDDVGDYDNLQEKQVEEAIPDKRKSIPESEKITLKPIECKPEIQRELDEIMKVCQEVMDEEEAATERKKSRSKSGSCEKLLDDKSPSLSVEKSPPYSTPVEDLSSPLKSSSVTPNNNFPKSSSLTSFHAFSSSDYLKSPSSERGNMSNFDRCVKSNSTTSYDVKSTTASVNSDETLSPVEPNSMPQSVERVIAPASSTSVSAFATKAIIQPNVMKNKKEEPVKRAPLATTSEFVAEPSPLPPTTVTSSGDRDRDSSQYNSSEELAMIFGIRQPSVTPPTGNQVISFSEWNAELESAVDGEDDEIDLDRNNNSLSAINNNSFAAGPHAYQNSKCNNNNNLEADTLVGDLNYSPKSAPPKQMHGMRYFGTKRNELEIIFENPYEQGSVYEDPETEDLFVEQLLDKKKKEKQTTNEDDLDIKFTSEIVISKDKSVEVESRNRENDKLYTNELEIDVGVESENGATICNDVVVGELDDNDDKQDLSALKIFEEKVCKEEIGLTSTTASGDERGSDLESSSSSIGNKSESAIANKLNLPLTCNDRQPRVSSETSERSTSNGPVMRGVVARRHNSTDTANQDRGDVANGKERPNLLHPEHFLFASLAYQGLTSYDDILTVLAILIALITLIALIFI